MAKPKELRGCSKIALPQGTLREVRSYDGALCMTTEEWRGYQRQIGAQVGRTASELLATRPQLGDAFGMAPDAYEKAVTIMDLLGNG